MIDCAKPSLWEMLSTTILIVGSGPVGLWLAYNIKRMDPNLDVLIIDSIPSRAERNKFFKALSITAGTLETFESRGIANLFLEGGKPTAGPMYAGMPIYVSEKVLGVRHPFNIFTTQTEEILLRLCEDAGVRFEWGCELVYLTQDDAGVAIVGLNVDEHELERDCEINIDAHWIVGCDGCQSKICELAGIEFEGTSTTMFSILADFQLSEPI